MTSMRYVDRGYRETLALIPGWATDSRIFDALNLSFNYLLPIDFSPFTFENGLLNAMKERKIDKISIFGWSLGGFVAQEFSLRHADLIDEIILIGMRKKYEPEGLSKIRKYLKKSKEKYLYKFYSDCFSEKEDKTCFEKHLLKVYCRELDLEYLLKTLDYLENSEIKPEALNNIKKKIKIVHGKSDKIAPIEETIDIRNSLPDAEFVGIEGAGHMPFLRKDFHKFI